MKTLQEIRKVMEEQFYEDVMNFHIAALRDNFKISDFLKRRRAIIRNAVSSITEEKKNRRAISYILEEPYGNIRDLHMVALQEAISLNAFHKRKKDVISDAASVIHNFLCNN